MTVHCFGPNGKTLWTHKLDPKRYHPYGHELHPHDVDGDGLDEIFIGLNRTTLALTHDGKVLWEDRSQRNHTDFFQFGDIDGDGRIEVVYDHDGCGGNGPFLVVDGATGKRDLEIDYRRIGLVHAQCLAVGDFRPDLPGLELVCTDKSAMIAAWDAKGRLLWQHKHPSSLVTRADWDGDGAMDLVVVTVGKHVDPALSVWDGHGRRLYAISWLPSPLRSHAMVCSRELAQHVQRDLDGNGRADLLVGFGPWHAGSPQNLFLLEAPAAKPQ